VLGEGLVKWVKARVREGLTNMLCSFKVAKKSLKGC
jgi:hypothetical protein